MTRCSLLITLAALASACGSAASPTSPSTVGEAALVEELFTGTLAPTGHRSYAFSAPTSSVASAMLASLSTDSTPSAAHVRVGLGLGVPRGTGCALHDSVTVTPGLTAQLRGLVGEGIHCIAVFDTGVLTEPVSFAVRLVHY